MAEYSNKTYRVDDVDFSVTPASKFDMKDGDAVTYKAYYKKVSCRVLFFWNDVDPLQSLALDQDFFFFFTCALTIL